MILITGATGTAGSEIVKRLSAAGKRSSAFWRATSRRPRGWPDQASKGDFRQPETLDRALQGVDRALLLSSPDPKQVELQGNFIRAAKRAGVKHVVKFFGYGRGCGLAGNSAPLAW